MTPQEQEDAQVVKDLQGLGRHIDGQLPYGWGFVLLAFPFGSGGRMNYVANSHRGDVVRAMYEFIDASKGRFGEHIAETEGARLDEENARLRHRIAYLEGLMLGLEKGEVGQEAMWKEIQKLLDEQRVDAALSTDPGQGKS